jgi:hypothetical protein
MKPISPMANLDGAAGRGEDSERGRVADDTGIKLSCGW